MRQIKDLLMKAKSYSLYDHIKLYKLKNGISLKWYKVLDRYDDSHISELVYNGWLVIENDYFKLLR